MQNLSHWWYYSWSGWNTFHGHCCSWWLIDLPFVKYFCSLVQLHYSLLSSFTRKQQLAKYNTAFVLDFWSLQTTFAQPKDRWARRWAPFTWPSFFYGDQLPPWFLGGQLPSSHRRTCLPPPQEDLILLTWILKFFPLRLEIASKDLELASGRLVGPTNWTKCRTVYRFLSFW